MNIDMIHYHGSFEDTQGTLDDHKNSAMLIIYIRLIALEGPSFSYRFIQFSIFIFTALKKKYEKEWGGLLKYRLIDVIYILDIESRLQMG